MDHIFGPKPPSEKVRSTLVAQNAFILHKCKRNGRKIASDVKTSTQSVVKSRSGIPKKPAHF